MLTFVINLQHICTFIFPSSLSLNFIKDLGMLGNLMFLILPYIWYTIASIPTRWFFQEIAAVQNSPLGEGSNSINSSKRTLKNGLPEDPYWNSGAVNFSKWGPIIRKRVLEGNPKLGIMKKNRLEWEVWQWGWESFKFLYQGLPNFQETPASKNFRFC